jgi:macrolide-specific efflux system membrane fusion protein
VVPTSAIQTTAFGSFVTALDSHNQIVRMPVQTGISDLNNTAIVSGLSAGQRIVVPQASGLAGGTTGSGRRGGLGGALGGGFGGGFGGGRAGRTGG